MGVQTRGRESVAKPVGKMKEEADEKARVSKLPAGIEKIDKRLSQVLPASNSPLLD